MWRPIQGNGGSHVTSFCWAQVDLFASQETTHWPWWCWMVGPRGTLRWMPECTHGPGPFCTLSRFPLLPVAQARVLLVAPDWDGGAACDADRIPLV